MEARFFANMPAFRTWLEKNHATATVLVVGFYKKESGRPSITYPEARDQALCFGWIDGVRNSIDGLSYKIRFTPRRPRSAWSAVNIDRVAKLKESGQMAEAGLKAFETRAPERTGLYSFENKPKSLDPIHEKKFRANKKAWTFFQSQAPWYQRTAMFWIMSAKKEETRQRRLAELIADSEAGRSIKPLQRKTSSTKPVH